MSVSPDGIIIVGAILVFVSILVTRASSRFGIPTLLLFLLVGMLFGSDGLGVQFYDAKLAQFIGMISLSIILFTGGMDTKIVEIRPILVKGILLSTIGVLLTAVITGVFIYFLTQSELTSVKFSLIVSLLLASTMASTDSASVFSILRNQRMGLKNHLKPLLELESGSNDPMAYMLTITLIQLVKSDTLDVWHLVFFFLLQFVLGGIMGLVLGRTTIFIINRIKISYQSLYPLLLSSLIFITFALTNVLGGNGYLAVYIVGIMVGNFHVKKKKEMNSFLESLTMLSQIVMFLSLGLLVVPHEMIRMIPISVLISVFMMLVARPISVMLCLLPYRDMSRKAKIFVSWVGLRGAVPIIFATYPVVANVEGANHIFNIVFVITLLSLILQGTTIPKVAKWLKIDRPLKEKKNNFGVELPEELNTHLLEMELTDEMLLSGNTLSVMDIPPKTLVMLVKRGEIFLVPNGSIELRAGDKLLIISENEQLSMFTA